jgi:hypothetical protein
MLIVHPTITENGSSPEALFNRLDDAREALGSALDKLVQAAPRARDYPNSDAFSNAMVQHFDRCRAVEGLMRELAALMHGINQ